MAATVKLHAEYAPDNETQPTVILMAVPVAGQPPAGALTSMELE